MSIFKNTSGLQLDESTLFQKFGSELRIHVTSLREPDPINFSCQHYFMSPQLGLEDNVTLLGPFDSRIWFRRRLIWETQYFQFIIIHIISLRSPKTACSIIQLGSRYNCCIPDRRNCSKLYPQEDIRLCRSSEACLSRSARLQGVSIFRR